MKKGNNRLLIVIIAIIVIALIGGICIYTAGLVTKVDGDQTDGDSENTVLDIKMDDSKDYVYDADYKYDNVYTEFSRMNERDDATIDYYGIPIQIFGKEYLKNLKVPYININSSDAKTANKELEELYLKYAKEFDDCAKDMDTASGGYGMGCSQVLMYKTYKYNDVLSVVVVDGESATSPFIFNYHVYNFNLKNGNKILYDDMLVMLNYEKENVLDKINSSVKNKMDSVMANNPEEDLTTACSSQSDGKYETTNCYDITYKLIKESIEDGSILYLTDDSGELNILPILYFDFFQNGTLNHYLIKVSK